MNPHPIIPTNYLYSQFQKMNLHHYKQKEHINLSAFIPIKINNFNLN